MRHRSRVGTVTVCATTSCTEVPPVASQAYAPSQAIPITVPHATVAGVVAAPPCGQLAIWYVARELSQSCLCAMSRSTRCCVLIVAYPASLFVGVDAAGDAAAATEAEAAAIVQAWWRGTAARATLQAIAEQASAATRLQAVYRGHAVRRGATQRFGRGLGRGGVVSTAVAAAAELIEEHVVPLQRTVQVCSACVHVACV